MSERIRVLNEEGALQFRQFVESVRTGSVLATPLALLRDPATSSEIEPKMTMEEVPLTSRLDLGRNLAAWLRPSEQRVVSWNIGLWNWLSLRFFDQLCPQDGAGKRKVLQPSHYVLDHAFSYQHYYRHLVRFAWLAYATHGERARILLCHSGKASEGIGQWGEISEQLGARQDILGNKTIIDAAGLLYLDDFGNPIRGATSRDRKGVVRRLADIANQLGLTYDLRTCPVADFLNLLPPEYERWVREFRKRASKEIRYPPSTGASEAGDFPS
jgi:hypothetical protein